MDQPQSASRILRPKHLNRNIQCGILPQGFANRMVATDALEEDESSVLVLHCAKRRHRWHQSINVGRGDRVSGGHGSRECAKRLRPRLHFGACTGLVRNDMNGAEMAKGNRPTRTRDLGAIDIYATGDQIKPIRLAVRQFQDFFPRVRECRNLRATGIRRRCPARCGTLLRATAPLYLGGAMWTMFSSLPGWSADHVTSHQPLLPIRDRCPAPFSGCRRRTDATARAARPQSPHRSRRWPMRAT